MHGAESPLRRTPTHRLSRSHIADLVVLALLVGIGLWSVQVALAQAPSSSYVPCVFVAGSDAQPTPTSVPGQPTPTPTRVPDPGGEAGFLLPGEDFGWTEYADIAIDSAGGHHIVYLGLGGILTEGPPEPAYYAYCPAGADCADPALWQVVALNLPADPDTDSWSAVELAVGPGRVAFVAYAEDFPAVTPRTLVYAECSSNCAAAAGSWRSFALLEDPDNTNFTGRSFALDPQGRPRLVYHADFGDELHLASCDASNCADGTQWLDLELTSSTEWAYSRSEYLAFTADGKARMVSVYSSDTEDGGFTYWECDSGCTQSAANWHYVSLYPSEDPFGFALDPQGRPRATIYGSGDYGSSPDIQPETFNYVWCDSGCLSASSWHESTIGSPAGEAETIIFPQQQARLAIDGTGRPYVAYYYEDMLDEANNGLHLYYCTQGCQADGDNKANWTRQLVETTVTLDAAEPIPVMAGYQASWWQYVGQFPRLSFDPAGNVWMVYANIHMQARINDSDQIDSLTDLMMSRLKAIAQP